MRSSKNSVPLMETTEIPAKSLARPMRLVWQALLLSVPLFLVVGWSLWLELARYRQSESEVAGRARQAATFYAGGVASRLNTRFTELQFTAYLLLGVGAAPRLPSPQIDDALRRLVALNPGLYAFNIQSPEGNVILWSTHAQSRQPITPPGQFTPLPGNADFLLGQDSYAARAGAHVLTMRYRLRGPAGKTLYFIGAPYRVRELLADGEAYLPWRFTVVDKRDGSVMGVWRQGQVGFGGTAPSVGKTRIAVPGYPLVVVPEWSPALVRQTYLQTAPLRWVMEIGSVLLLGAIALGVLKLLRQRERNARHLRRLADFNAMLAQVNEVIASERDEAGLLQATCDIAVRHGHLALASIARPDASGRFRFIASAGATGYLDDLFVTVDPDVPEGQGAMGRAWREGRAYYVPFEKTAFLQPWRARAQRFGLKSAAVVPILRGRQVWALFAILHDETDVFDEASQALAEELALDIGRGLDRIDAAARERHLAALQKRLLDNTFAGIALISDGEIAQANPRLAQMLGFPSAEALQGMQARRLFRDQGEYQRATAVDAERQVGETAVVANLNLVRQDGDEIICDLAVGLVREPERAISVWTLQDVTERERTRAQLLLLNDRLSLATAASEAGVWDYDPQNDRLTWDERLYALYGVSSESFSGAYEAWSKCVHPEDLARVQAQLQQALSGECNFDVEFRIIRPDGEIRWIGAKAVMLRDSSGVAKRVIGVNWDVTERHEAEARVQYQAMHDPLTQLPNRWSLEAELGKVIAHARRNESAFAVGMLDLDDFKPVNDAHGHSAGDRLLQELAQRLKQRLREVDFLARIGGDEFVVVLDELDIQHLTQQLTVVLNRLHEAVESPFEVASGKYASVGMSLGLALFPSDAEEGDALLRMADAALYQSKTHKASRLSWWSLANKPADEEAPEPVLEPYGAHATELLGRARGHWEKIAEPLVQTLYQRLAGLEQAQSIFSFLSVAERDRLVRRQGDHFRFMLDPATKRQAVVERGRDVGQVHALCGVGSGLIVEAFLIYRDLLNENLEQTYNAKLHRKHLQLIVENRLQDDLQAQLKAVEATSDAYLSYLATPLPGPGTLWVDAAARDLRALGQLPGLHAAALMRPDVDGRFQIEDVAGNQAQAVYEVTCEPAIQPTLDEQQSLGSSLVAQAWRARRIMSAASYLTDAQFAPWHAAFAPLGLRSGLAVPVLDANGYPVVAIRLHGAYPGQFESAWMQQFARGLQQRWAELWQRCSASAPSNILPQDVAEHYRMRAFTGGLVVHVQPVVNLVTGQVEKVEALARLRLENGQIVEPSLFMPLLGNRELDELFRLGLDQALTELGRWDAQGWNLGISVNLAPATLLDPDCVHWVRAALQRHGIEPSRLTLEILETQELQKAEQGAATERLAALGVNLAMDDLGSGYSSLLRLSGLPFHTIKIDQGLVARLRTDPLKTLGLIAALIQVGRDFELDVVVEGLEDVDVVEAVAVMGASSGQGHALGHPMPAEELLDWRRHFTLPIVPGTVRTALGALAYHWNFMHSGAGQYPTDLSNCPLTAFFTERGLRDSALSRWHAQVHQNSDRAAASRQLTEALVTLLHTSST